MKRLSILLAMIVAFAAFAIAEDCPKEMTVEEVNQLQDGDEVKLEGKLEEHEEENIYLYKDDTGEIKVEISQEVWEEENLQFNPDQKYEIEGELVKENETLHVKADEIEEADHKEEQTVEEIKQLQEGDSVELEGKLEELEEENIYLYKDDTGEIKVEISQEVWEEEYIQFNPDQKYEIEGELVKENETLHVKADEIEEADDDDDDDDEDDDEDDDDEDGFLF